MRDIRYYANTNLFNFSYINHFIVSKNMFDVLTDNNELREIHDVIDSILSTPNHITVTPDIVKQCIHKLKPGKDYGYLGFKSDHIINGSHRLHVLLSLLYNLMVLHGYTPTNLLKSSIISIPKHVQVSLSNTNSYRGISLFNCICKLYVIMLLYFCKGIICI